LLTRSGLTYPEISSKVYHDSFCQLGSSVSLHWVIYFEAFYLRYNCFARNGGNAITKHARPEAKGSNPTAGLTLLWARNPFRGNFDYLQISRTETGQIFFMFLISINLLLFMLLSFHGALSICGNLGPRAIMVSDEKEGI